MRAGEQTLLVMPDTLMYESREDAQISHEIRGSKTITHLVCVALSAF